jgi:hypothetical protein
MNSARWGVALYLSRTGVVDLGVLHWQLLTRSDLDHLSQAADLLPVGRRQRQAQRVRVHDHVPHSTVGNVDLHRADGRHLRAANILMSDARCCTMRCHVIRYDEMRTN